MHNIQYLVWFVNHYNIVFLVSKTTKPWNATTFSLLSHSKLQAICAGYCNCKKRKLATKIIGLNKCYPKLNSVCKSIVILCFTFQVFQGNKLHQSIYKAIRNKYRMILFFVGLKSYWQYIILLLVSSWKIWDIH